MADLWKDLNLFAEEVVESQAIKILREQARLLNKKTNGMVKATFSKINYKTSFVETFVEAVGTAMPDYLKSEKAEILEDDLKDKEDLNEMYTSVRYKFEIFNDTYRFRIFTLNYKKIFPIQIEIDGGIRKELNIQSASEDVNSDEELTELVSKVFSSRKLSTIISKMMSQQS